MNSRNMTRKQAAITSATILSDRGRASALPCHLVIRISVPCEVGVIGAFSSSATGAWSTNGAHIAFVVRRRVRGARGDDDSDSGGRPMPRGARRPLVPILSGYSLLSRLANVPLDTKDHGPPPYGT